VFTLNLQNPSSVILFLINDKEPSDSVVTGHSSINYIFQFHPVLDFFGKKKMKKKNSVRLKQRQET
jgi:hypothetical protein